MNNEPPIRLIATRIISDNSKKQLESCNILVEDYAFVSQTILENRSTKKTNIEKDVIFTSYYGVLGAEPYCSQKEKREYKCYCISGRTREIAEKKGYVIAGSAKSAIELAEIIMADRVKKLTYFTKQNHRKELVDSLLEDNVNVEIVTVYEDTNHSHTISGKIDGILFFSPSQIEAYERNNTMVIDIPKFCIGNTTASALHGIHQNIHVSSIPSEESLVETIIQYYSK